ncbi:MAG: hypothetical protein ACYC0H_23925, partial [Solirubrobacteraceae bacterium]
MVQDRRRTADLWRVVSRLEVAHAQETREGARSRSFDSRRVAALRHLLNLRLLGSAPGGSRRRASAGGSARAAAERLLQRGLSGAMLQL